MERGENVVVNLRRDADVETEFVGFDRPRVVRVLERIAADLDNLSLISNDTHADKESSGTPKIEATVRSPGYRDAAVCVHGKLCIP